MKLFNKILLTAAIGMSLMAVTGCGTSSDPKSYEGVYKKGDITCVLKYDKPVEYGSNDKRDHYKLYRTKPGYEFKGKRIAAICAAPTVFGALGLLKEKAACCYPGMEEQLNCKEAKFCSFVTDGNITTSRGVGTAIPFALELIRQLFGNEKASEIAESIVYEE